MFVHLRLHSEFSVVDGTNRIDEVVAAAAANAQPALAITDLSNLFGAVKFYLAARAKGVQPIIGCDLAITNERNRDQAHRVLDPLPAPQLDVGNRDPKLVREQRPELD